MEIEMTYQNSLLTKREASLGIQILTGLIDSVITLASYLALSYYTPDLVTIKFHFPFAAEISIYLLFAIYRTLSLLLFNGTIGMKTCKINLLNGELEHLSIFEKTCAGFFLLINGVDYYNK